MKLNLSTLPLWDSFSYLPELFATYKEKVVFNFNSKTVLHSSVEERYNPAKIIILFGIGDNFDPFSVKHIIDKWLVNNICIIFVTPNKLNEKLILESFNNYSNIRFFCIPSLYYYYTNWFGRSNLTVKNIQKHFLSTNNRSDFGKLSLFFYFIRNNLLDKSYFSYLGEDRPVAFDDLIKNGADFYLNQFDVHNNSIIDPGSIKKMIPYSLPGEVGNPMGTTIIGLEKFYNQSFLSIVVETFAGDTNTPFFTEKTFKPIAMKQPFILLNSKHSLKALHDLGFKTFDGVIDESYDHMDQPDRTDFIFREIKRISNFTIEELKEKHKLLEDVLEHNYNHFYNVLPKMYQSDIEQVGKEIDVIIKEQLNIIN